MGLAEYNKKRHFEKTPEPAGKEAPAGGRLFIIQKHAATRLHYDFRLELDGVLLSWAVPKGPSYDPKDKRLAVHVEDHPVEYGSFEGVIPKGEYGGGTVVLWDRGWWEPTSDPRKGMEKGRLEFVLHGEKCEGGWLLTRMGRAEEGKENWLLIKRKDGTEDPARDITAEAPLSVATGRSMEEIASDKDRVWSSHVGEVTAKAERDPISVPGSRKAAMPETMSPELCTRVMEAPDGEGWIHEIKLDGYRALLRVEGGKARAISRSDKDWSRAFAPVTAHASALPVEQAWIDGEVCVLRSDGTTDFQALQNDLGSGRTDRLVFFAFDLVYLDGRDLRPAKLVDRKAALKELLARGPSGPIRYLDHVEGEGRAFFRQACQLALEGAIAKRADAEYRSARTKDWLKIQCIGREDFLIAGYTRPQGSREGFGSLILALPEGDGFKYVGRVGTGFNSKSIADLMERMAPLVVKEPPVPGKIPGVRGATWVRPELVASVAFSQWTDEGLLRHPSFKGLRTDVEGVTTEAPAAGQSARPKPRRVKGRSGGEEAEIGGIRVTNPDRVLWKDVGVTKEELAEYYARHAEYILPHVRRRPLTMLRCPNGVADIGPKGCFFQKHATTTVAKGLIPVDIKTEEEPYLYVDDLDGLLGLVQMGVLEIHPWGSTVDDLERPDRLIFDLDPDEGLPWERVAEGALVVRTRLAELGLESWPKSTGGKGLHVCVPLKPSADWDEAKQFCEDFANLLVRAEPKKYTSKIAKDRRTGKIFVDWLRNARGATAVSAWSTRARPGAPIAAPITWEEVLKPVKVGLRDADSRDWDVWEGFADSEHKLTPEILRAAKK